MTAEEFRNAKDLWRMEYAHATFKSVEDGIKSLLERGLNQSSPEYYPLSVGTIWLYCRPFTDNALVGQISVKVVPEEYRQRYHDRVLQFRNEIFAHTAGDAILGANQYMNSVKLSGSEPRVHVLSRCLLDFAAKTLASQVFAITSRKGSIHG